MKPSLRKASEMCMIFPGISKSHETVRNAVPDIPHTHEKMKTSGYFSYDEQYVLINGIRKYRVLLKDLFKRIHDASMGEELKGAKNLITYMFFQTGGNLEKLGNNVEHVRRIAERMSEKESTFRILQLIRDLYSGNRIIRKFLKNIDRNRKSVFLYLDDPMIHKTNNVAEHHFSVRSELLKNRFKTEGGLLKMSYLYRKGPTEI